MSAKDAKRDESERRFEVAPYNGFIVTNFAAFDQALQKLERVVQRKVEKKMTSGKISLLKPPFALIEFARNDYQRAFSQFTPEFLKDAYFLYLDTDIETCKQRIRKRFAKERDKKTSDDYFVSDRIFEIYYSIGEKPDLVQIAEGFGIGPQRVQVIENNNTLREISQQIASFMETVFAAEAGEKPSAYFAPPSSHTSGLGKLLHLALF